jgi:uncharacterized damage-inducible protein DinB
MLTEAMGAQSSRLDMIRWLFRFSDWTRPHVIGAVSRASAEQLHQPGLIAGGVEDGSLFATLAHTVDAEEGWLARWMGAQEDAERDPVAYATIESIARQWEMVQQTRDAWLATLSAEDLDRPSRAYAGADGVVNTVPLWPMFFHVLNHTAHHRAEIYETLTRLGLPPEHEADVMDFAREQLGVISPFTVAPVSETNPA